MAMVDLDDNGLLVKTQPKLVELGVRLADTWR